MQIVSEPKSAIIRKLGASTINAVDQTAISSISNSLLNSLIHTVGHDLRSPIFVVRSYAQLLQRTQEKQRLERGFQLIEEATHKMESTINSLVKLIDIYSLPVPQMKLILFEDCFEQAKNELYNELKEFEPSVELDFEGCSSVHFNQIFLREIFIQLIDNAMRHNANFKNLKIRVRTRKIGNETVLEVEDNGQGISSAEERQKIMQPFYSNSSSKCSGIGLSKIQAIAQVCKGFFEIENNQDQGVVCRFYFLKYK